MILLWFLAGGVAEVLNMLTRKWSVKRASPKKPKRAVVLIVISFLFRLGWTGLILGLALSCGPAFGLAAFIGYWLSRWVMICWIKTC